MLLSGWTPVRIGGDTRFGRGLDLEASVVLVSSCASILDLVRRRNHLLTQSSANCAS